MAVFVVTYRYTEGAADARAAVRPIHREFTGALAEQGYNLASGPVGADETPGAVFLVSAADKAAALALLADDPFQIEGLVAEVTAVEWQPVTGPLVPGFPLPERRSKVLRHTVSEDFRMP